MLLIALALLAMVPASALNLHDGQKVAAKAPNGNPFIITILEKFTSTAGEDEIAFLKRVGVYMQNYTAQEKVETCASIWENAQKTQWTLQVTTSSSHITCVIVTENPTLDASLVMDAASIHSHPLVHEIKVDATDALLTGATEGKPLELFNATFSPADKDAGPGFLVANRHLQYQRDGGKIYTDFGPLVR